jgi:hypothetical protein
MPARATSFASSPRATADIDGMLIHGAQGVRSCSVLPIARTPENRASCSE